MSSYISHKMIADRLGVSRATVSFVLNGKAREKRISPAMEEKVLHLARELGYVPNRMALSLKQKRSGTIGVSLVDFHLDWAYRLHQGLKRSLIETDTVPLFAPRGADPAQERRELNWLMGHRVDGFLVCVGMQENLDAYADLISSGIPLVFVADIPSGLEERASTVMWDSPARMAEMVTLLAGTGRRNMVWAGLESREKMGALRFGAFRETSKGVGSRCPAKWNFAPDKTRFFSTPRMVEQWITEVVRPNLGKIDAIVCINDWMSFIVLEALDSAGISVPGDLVVTGVGDQPLSGEYYNQVVTIPEPIEELGRLGGQLLMDLIAGQAESPTHLMVPSGAIIDRVGILPASSGKTRHAPVPPHTHS